MAEHLVSQVTALLDRAEAAARTEEARTRLVEARSRLQGPLRVAIAGKVKAGKSTLLNAILGEELAPTDASECTKIVTWYQRGNTPSVAVHLLDGQVVHRPWNRQGGALEVDLGDLRAAQVSHLMVTWPTTRLRELTILDTPGIASISTDVSQRTHRVMSADDGRVPVADAVLYLMRHTHASDVRFLEAFHDDELAHGTPMNSVGVLSRADEIGSCRLNAMEVADQIARRYEADPRMRRLCPIILPVDGLLAHAAVSLRQSEFALLTTVAQAPRAEIAELLLTVDRFARRPSSLRVTELERSHLLERMGLFGVRLSVELIISGRVSNASELAAELAARSGLERLRSVVLRQFEQRSRVLRARSALAILSEVLQSGGCADTPVLLAALEQLRAGTQEFEELRLLGSLRSGGIDLRPERVDELDRLLGGSGHDPASRLGIDSRSDAAEVHAAALAALRSWQRLAEHPMSSRGVQVAARTATRTLEGILDDTAPSQISPSRTA